uniref:GPR180/TMEM145 transmembrane domain-containing protein n=1 Tax=Panagrolaimus sp. PS1159 TaxID=55785 RepID=A0AC35FBQ3_9BILA
MLQNEFLLFLFSLFFVYCNGKYSRGILTSEKNWVYLDRFCFVSQKGKFSYEFQYPASFAVESMYMYYDTADQWKAAYNGSLTCQQRENILKPDNNQIIPLTPNAAFEDGAKCIEITRFNNTWYWCKGERSFFSMRPRWWYIAIGNCDADKTKRTLLLYLEYKILMTNAEPSNRWFYHFSFDEFYTLPITIAFMILELLLLIIAVVFTYMLKSRNMLHTTYKIFLYSMAFEFAALSLWWLHYDRFADDGSGFPSLKMCALFFRQMATITFIFLLLLMGKGYTITRARLSSRGTIRLFLFMVGFIMLEIATVIWEVTLFDPAQVTYISESFPSYFVLLLRLIAWSWFIRASAITVHKYPTKRTFYAIMSSLLSLWFIAGPIVTIFANFVLDNWVRSEVVHGVDSGVVAYGFIIFLVLTCPLQDNRYFPYHVRANQVTDCDFPENVQYTANPPVRDVDENETGQTASNPSSTTNVE